MGEEAQTVTANNVEIGQTNGTNSLHGEAKRVACPDYDPARADMLQLSGIEYEDRLSMNPPQKAK